MTGPEHYRRAEALTEAIRRQTVEGTANTDATKVTAAVAQVHATLALAAATAIATQGEMPFNDAESWEMVAGKSNA